MSGGQPCSTTRPREPEHPGAREWHPWHSHLHAKELPEHFEKKYAHLIGWLRSDPHDRWVRFTIGFVVNLIRAVTYIREGIADRRMAQYLLGHISYGAKYKLGALIMRMLRAGEAELATELAEFWHEYMQWSRQEIREKPDFHTY